jgi:hypothetical protein
MMPNNTGTAVLRHDCEHLSQKQRLAEANVPLSLLPRQERAEGVEEVFAPTQSRFAD